MSNKAEWIDAMWKWTMIPLMAFFVLALAVVIFGLVGFLLGDAQTLNSDGFQFFLIAAAFCVPFYLFLRFIRAVVRSGVSSASEP